VKVVIPSAIDEHNGIILDQDGAVVASWHRFDAISVYCDNLNFSNHAVLFSIAQGIFICIAQTTSSFKKLACNY
jgi:hypothetical protein